MNLVEFESRAELEQRALALLSEHLSLSADRPHAVMLSGGQTPLGLYRRLERSPAPTDPALHLLLSDERHVPRQSPENNYAQIRPMVRALHLDESQVLRVHTELPPHAAADRYHEELASYVREGGRITLGFLGLGPDGHTASLFDKSDLARATGRYAIAVPRPTGPDRVSVTPDLLSRIELLVILAAGQEKVAIVQEVLRCPEKVVAAQAVRGARTVELWFAGQHRR